MRPAEDLEKGEVFRTEVDYSGKPKPLADPDGSKEGWITTEDGAVAVGEPLGSMTWFPGNHHPSDKAAYDVTITVPRGYEAVSNGELRSRVEGTDGRTVFAWHSPEPMASYLATAAIGRYKVTTGRTPSGSASTARWRPGRMRRVAVRSGGCRRWWSGAAAGSARIPSPRRVRSWCPPGPSATRWRPRAARLPRRAERGARRARARAPVVRRFGVAEVLEGHVAQRGFRDLRRVAVGRGPRRAHGAGALRSLPDR